MSTPAARGTAARPRPLQGSNSKDYIHKPPFTLTWPFLSGLALYIIGLLVAIELSRHAFPNVDNRDIQYSAAAPESPYLSAPAYGRKEAAAPSPMSTGGGGNLGNIHRLGRRVEPRQNSSSTRGSASSSSAVSSTDENGIKTASIKPTVTDPSHGKPTFQPFRLGYRFFYSSSNLSSSLNTSSLLLPRRPEEESYGTLGHPQKVVFMMEAASKSKSIFEPGGFGIYIAYLSDATELSDLQAMKKDASSYSRMIDWYTGSHPGLCGMQCNGPFVVISSEACLSLWEFADGYQRDLDDSLGMELSVTESEHLGGTRCPMPTKEGRNVAYEVGVPVTETHNGVETTTTKQTRITMATPFEMGTAASTTLTPTTRTIIGADGKPILAVTTTQPLTLVPATLTLTDPQGRPTHTLTTALPLRPTPPPGRSRSGTNRTTTPGSMHPLSPTEYFLATFGPVLLALPLTIAAQALGAQTKAQLPFYALSLPAGARAADSLCLRTRGLPGLRAGWRVCALGGPPLGVLADVLVGAAAVAVALSGEAVGVLAYGGCARGDGRACFRGVAVYGWVSRAAEGALGVLLVVVGLLAVFAARMPSRVNGAPMSIAGLMALMGDAETRRVVSGALVVCDGRQVRERDVIDALDEHIFSLSARGNGRGGVVITTTKVPETSVSSKALQRSGNKSLLSGLSDIIAKAQKPSLHRQRNKATAITSRRSASLDPVVKVRRRLKAQFVIRWIFLVILCGFVALIVYYESTQLQTAFEEFMDNQNFGERLLFTSIGVLISFFWESQFSRVSILEPYRCLALRPQSAQTSILLSPATTPFIGLVKSLAQHNLTTASVALMAVLASCAPILLSNIPFNPVQTWNTHQACAWMSVGILTLMILVLLFEWIFVEYPHLPVHPGSLFGSLYYICDSQMTKDFCQETVLANERATLPRSEMGVNYRLENIIGMSGRRRIGVDYAADTDRS